MKVRDLVRIPDVETVIQVSSVERMAQDELHKRIVDSFVITEDILSALESIMITIHNKKGSGFILKGNYGSGKSHLLAFLSALLKYSTFYDNTIQKRPELATHKYDSEENRILPVSITLTDYSANNSLSEIVTERISDVFKRDGLDSPLWDPKRLIEDFKRFTGPEIERDFLSYTKEFGIDIDRLSPAEHSNIILRFLKERNIPFRPFYNYQDFFNEIESALKDEYPGGLFLLIDELSEFLRARGRGDLVAEDIRFIQFLGEKSRESSLRVILAMQESIEEVAEISTEGLNRIKDRYPVRINLTAVHLRELVEKRLLIKKPEALPKIDDIYLSLSDSFPEWDITKEDFRAIYPVHPATFRMLEGIAGLFSKTRGMVDFIYTETKGDKARNIPGILDRDAETLLLPHRLFDHFRNNLQESVEYHKLINTIFSTFEKDIARIFKCDNDRDLALRLIKLILLIQILPGTEKPTAKELTHLVMEARFDIDPEYNYVFIRDKILKVMERECPFLGMEKGETPVEDSFSLLYQENPAALFETKVKQFIAKNVNLEKQALWFFISGIEEKEIPLSDFKGDGKEVYIHFENTIREGSVYLKSIKKLSIEDQQRIDILLNNTECDFILFIGFPVEEGDEVEIFKELPRSLSTRIKDNIFYWKPAIVKKDELHRMQEAYARIKVYESEYLGSKMEAENDIISEMVEQAESIPKKVIKRLYGDGSLYSIKDGVLTRNDIILTGNFEKTVELMLKDPLKKAFQGHSRIMPHFEIATKEIYNQIITLFRERGEVDFNFEGNRIIRHAIDGILKNSGLIKIFQNIYKISPEPAKNIFVKELLYEIEERAVSFKKLYLLFRKGKYGIQRELFALYLFFLAYSGFITIERTGRSMKPDRLDLNSITESELIRTGEEISTLFIEKHQLLKSFMEGLTAKNIHLQSQKQIWDKLVEFKRDNEENIKNSMIKLNKLDSYTMLKEYSLSGIRESLENLLNFISSIKVSKNSKDGLDILLSSMKDSDISFDIEVEDKFSSFIEHDFDRLMFIHEYLADPNLHTGDNDRLKKELISILGLFKDLDDLIIDNRLSVIFERFNEFKEEYSAHYLRAHRRIHSSQLINEIEKIKLSPSYRILAQLSKIENISVKDDLIRVDTIFNRIRMSQCNRSISQELETKPYCECRLKKSDIDIKITDIEDIIRSGIKQYLHAIKEDSSRNRITHFMGSLLSGNEQEKRDRLKSIIEVDEERVHERDLVQIINPEAIQLANRALSSNIKIVKKEIRYFYNSIFGRRFRKEELLRIFEEWLETEPSSDEEEIIFEITGFDEEKRDMELPEVLHAAIDRCINIDHDEIRLQAFALAWLLYHLAEDKYFSMINDILFIEIKPADVKPAIEVGKQVLKDSFSWGRLLPAERQEEILSLLLDKQTEPEYMINLFKASRGFERIREKLLEFYIQEESTLPSGFKGDTSPDDSPSGRILSAFLDLREKMKIYYRASGKKENFDPEYYSSAFDSLYQLEVLQSLSLNQNLLLHIIPEMARSLKGEIESDCSNYFTTHIEEWEGDKDIRADSIPFLITHSNPLLFIFDSLRLDLFQIIHERLTSESILKPISKGILISPYPSDTFTFRKGVLGQEMVDSGQVLELSGRKWVYIGTAERDYRKEELWSLLTEQSELGIIISFSIFDEKIHSTKQSIHSLSEEVSLFCDQIFIPLINGIQHDRRIYITSDHGFIENENYAGKEQQRYTHGGNSFYERIIPFAEYEKKGYSY